MSLKTAKKPRTRRCRRCRRVGVGGFWRNNDPVQSGWYCNNVNACRRRQYEQEKEQENRKIVAVEGSVWCDEHCTVHEDNTDPYGYGEDSCQPWQWRRLWAGAYVAKEAP